MMKIKGVRAPDELESGREKVQQRYDKRSGSRHRAEQVAIAHEMATEEARNTEVSTTRTERGRYGNAHIRYDINDGLVDVILEVIPSEEQRAEGIRDQKEQKGKRDIKEKYRPRSDEDA
jgi:hypothetical protein